MRLRYRPNIERSEDRGFGGWPPWISRKQAFSTMGFTPAAPSLLEEFVSGGARCHVICSAIRYSRIHITVATHFCDLPIPRPLLKIGPPPRNYHDSNYLLLHNHTPWYARRGLKRCIIPSSIYLPSVRIYNSSAVFLYIENHYSKRASWHTRQSDPGATCNHVFHD